MKFSDFLEESTLFESVDINATDLVKSFIKLETDIAKKLKRVKSDEYNKDLESETRADVDAVGVSTSNKVAAIVSGFFDDKFGAKFIIHGTVTDNEHTIEKIKVDRTRFDNQKDAEKFLEDKGYTVSTVK